MVMSMDLLHLDEDLFAPDAILPIQFHDLITRRRDMHPVYALRLAVLTEAIADFYIDPKRLYSKKIHRNAKDWLFGEDDSDSFSCKFILQLLDIEPQWLRTQLQKHLTPSTTPRNFKHVISARKDRPRK